MSTLTDFSFTNTQIKEFFEGSNSYIPVSELLYVHSHPLIKPNFLAEIESLVNITGEIMVQKKMSGAPVKKFTSLAQELGRELPELTEDNAVSVLGTLRDIYKMCTVITGKR